jgi:hypothetical protein
VIYLLAWALIKTKLLSPLIHKYSPWLSELRKERELVDYYETIPLEAVLFRWMNLHLKDAAYHQRPLNFMDMNVSSIDNSQENDPITSHLNLL